MKKISNSYRTIYKGVFSILLVVCGLFTFKSSPAQVNVSVNIVSQPLWGPVGYDYVEYYYLPEPDVYYYVPTGQFVYLSGGNWIFVNTLPAVYHVNLYNTYKVVVNEPKPYLRHTVYVTKYGKYKTYRNKQVVIRNSRDKKYYVVKGHPGSKVKVVKPKGAKPGGVKPGKSRGNSSSGGSVKPNNSNRNASRGSGARPGSSPKEASSRGNSAKPNSSKGNSSPGKGGKNR